MMSSGGGLNANFRKDFHVPGRGITNLELNASDEGYFKNSYLWHNHLTRGKNVAQHFVGPR